MNISYKTTKRKVQTASGKRVYKTYIDIDYAKCISEEQFLDIIKDVHKIPHSHALATLEAILNICMTELFKGNILHIPFLGTLRLKMTRAKYEKTSDLSADAPTKELSINFLPHKILRKTLKETSYE